MGWAHTRVVAAWDDERGQGTVEYVALILLVAALLAGVVAATKGTKFGTGGIAEAIVSQIRAALTKLG
jgi:Flp pilus assembly pilin Flp